MKTVFVIVFGLFNLLAACIAYENRASEKVVSAFVSISVSAVAAVCLAVFVFAEQSPIQTKFPISIFVDLRTGQPFSLIGIRSPTMADMIEATVSAIHAKHPEEFKSNKVATTYHELLQRLLLDWMSQVYFFTWQVVPISYDLPFSNMTMIGPATLQAPPGTTLETQEIVNLFPVGSLAREEVLRTSPAGTHKIVLPPGTKSGSALPTKILVLGKLVKFR